MTLLNDQRTIKNIIQTDFLDFSISELAQSIIAQNGYRESSITNKGIPINNRIIGKPKRASILFYP